MATAPKVTFGHKSVSANYISNPQITSAFSSSANQALISNPINTSVTYENSTNKVIVGQPIQAAAPIYQYRSNNVDPRTSTTIYNNNQKPNLPVTISTVVKEPVRIEEAQRPKYGEVPSSQAYNKYAQTSLCTPCCWIVGILVGLTLITLALLYGLGVIGGPINNPVFSSASPTPASSTQPSASVSNTNPSSPSSGASGSTSVSPLPSTTTPTTPTTSPNSVPYVDPIVVPSISRTS